MPTDATLPDQLAVLLSSSPELEEELKDAVERTRAGALDPAVVSAIVSCALFRLNHSGAANVATNPPDQGSRKPVVLELFKQTSRRIVAKGASLRAWLRAVDRIVFSPEPTHQPDAQLIADLVEFLLAGERPKLDD